MTLHIKNTSKAFGGIHAVSNCTLTVPEGKITGLIGPNGAGKTTLFDIITGIIPADNGSITYNQQELTTQNTPTIANLGISRTFQQVRLFKYLTIKDHLFMAMDHDDTKLLTNIFTPRAHDKEREEQAQHVLKLVGLHKPLTTLASDLSYGQRKLLDLAIALTKPHKLLMLDEPVAGVNPQIRKEIKQILKTLKRQGETILIIEHDMDFIMDLCDHIIVLDAGRVLTEGTPKKIQNNTKVLEAYLGEPHAHHH